MDPATLVDLPRDVVAAERERFENFKMGNPAQSNIPLNRTLKHAHTRSHSRNNSISISSSASLPFTFPVAQKPTSTSVGDMNHHFTFPLGNHNGATRTSRPLSMPLLPAATHANANNPSQNSANPGSDRNTQSGSSTKRNSHHRRRSSVSTRHESAELMGISLPDLPPSTSDDNVNFGEKDSIRRRALLALEGKPDVAFNKVEIPDFSSSDTEKLMSKSSLSSSSSFGNGLNNKRDSFKLLAASASSKDQLHTLVEEEEEEENEGSQNTSNPEHSLPSPTLSIKEISPLTPILDVSVTHPSKNRPATLHLRPLSLTPENLMTAPSRNSHTPSVTPISRHGLRSLSLLPSPANSEDSISMDSVQQSKRRSLIISPTPASKRPVLNLALCQLDSNRSPNGDGEEKNFPERRSSISYKRSSNNVTVNAAGLATPEMTPTTGRRFSNSGSVTNNSVSSIGGSTDEDHQLFPAPLTQARPLSASEQHFLFRSHNALLARITDLEKALSTRRRESYGAFSTTSRPLSVSSNISGTSDLESQTGSDGPSDEMLRLIADLKAERDELKRDVDGWRQRVNDLENQTTILVKRVESERRDAWVARSKAGLLEVEKGVLVRKLEAVDELSKLHFREKGIWEKERLAFGREVDGYRRKVDDLEQELEAVRMELEHEKAKVMSDPLATPTPNNMSFAKFVQPLVVISPPEPTRPSSRKHGLGFMSADSESSATDVELDSGDEGKFAFGLPLKVVQEESNEEDYHYDYEDDDDLATYEDEEDTDEMSIASSSSFGSENIHYAVHRYRDDVPPSPTTPTGAMFRPSHVSQPSLSQTWTFPIRPSSPARVSKKADETVDRFFDCLDDNDTDSDSLSNSPSSYSYEKSKGLFSRGFAFAPENDNASFFLPSSVDVPVLEGGEKEKDRAQLEVVVEEEEEGEEEQEYLEDEDMFGEIGGIKITFTPPQEEDDREEEAEERPQIQVSPPKTKRTSPPVLPALDFGDGGGDDDPFSFGHPLMEERFPSPPPPPMTFVSTSSSSLPVVPSTSTPIVASAPSSSSFSAVISSSASSVVPSSLPTISRSNSLSKRSPSISMIPRVASPLTVSRVTPPKPLISEHGNGTPPKEYPSTASSSSSPSPSYATPPNRRGCISPTFIPQPVASLSFVRTVPPAAPLKPKVAPSSTFIRQPSVRKPLLPIKAQNSTINSGSTNGSTMIPQPAINFPLDSRMNINPLNRSSSDRRPFASFFSSLVNNSSGSSASQVKADVSCDDDHHTQFQISQAPNNPSFSTVISPSPPPTRLSFQTLTNFVSWSSRNRSVSVAPSLPSMSSPSRSASSRPEKFPENREQFVSREKQLWRLKNRVLMEGVDVMQSGVDVQCKKCTGELVSI